MEGGQRVVLVSFLSLGVTADIVDLSPCAAKC